jgi:PAS domain S-box-containing protein
MESEKKYRMLTETMKDVVWIIDMESGQYLYISPSVKLQRGYSVSEVLSGSVEESLVPGQFEKFEKIVRTHLADFIAGKAPSESFFSLELAQPCKDGSTIITEAVVRIWRNPQTGKIELHGSTRDITIRKRIEEDLRESRRQHAAMLARLPGMAYRCGNDRGWTMQFVSSGCLELTGYAPDDLIGSKKVSYSDLIRPAYREPVWEEWQRVLREHRRFEGEYEITTMSGDVRWVWERGEGVYDEKGNVIALEGFISDITQRIITEKERTALQAQLVQAQKLESVGCLAGGVAHDFNNMLQAIIGYAEMALEQIPSDQPLYGDLVEIKKTALRSTNLTRQLLTFARKQAAEPKELDIQEALDGMSNMLRRLVGENIHIELKTGSGPCDVLLDKGQFEQVLFNLCINARDAIGKSGHITVEATNVVVSHGNPVRQHGVKPGAYVKISVKDDGPGIPENIRDRIFEPFFTTKPINEGSGLGLSVVYGIVTQAGGVIHLESELGKGTDFQIYLPCCSSRKTAPDVPTPVEPPTSKLHATILLVDDEILILRPAKKILESMGHKVIPTHSPVEAIRLLDDSTNKIDLLVTDVTMPDMSGPEMLVEMLKRHPKLKYIFMSGHTADLIARQGLDESKMNFIEKPFTKAELSAKIQEVLAG